MVETLAEIVSTIQTAITTALAANGIVPSTSQVAEWNLWVQSVAQAIQNFEVVQDAFQSDVEAYIDTKQPGSKSWYIQQALKWQYGYNVSVNATGQVYYTTIDPTAQIIVQCSCDEVVTAGVTELLLKVAAADSSGNFIPLTSEQLLEFSAYMERVKFAGTYISIVSQDADTIKYTYDVAYSGLYSATQMQAALSAALEVFRYAQRFDALFYQSLFADTIQNVPGVIASNKTLLTGTPAGGGTTDIGLSYALQSGYFNWDNTSSFNLIAA